MPFNLCIAWIIRVEQLFKRAVSLAQSLIDGGSLVPLLFAARSTAFSLFRTQVQITNRLGRWPRLLIFRKLLLRRRASGKSQQGADSKGKSYSADGFHDYL